MRLEYGWFSCFMKNQIEIWKDVKGYEGLYQVSNLGRVKSINRFLVTKKMIRKPIKEKILNQTTKNNGYKTVMFSLKNNQKRFKR